MKTLIINTSLISIFMYIFSFSVCADQLSTDMQDRNIDSSTVMTSKGTRKMIDQNQIGNQYSSNYQLVNNSVAPAQQNDSTGSRGKRLTSYPFNSSDQEKPDFNVNARGDR